MGAKKFSAHLSSLTGANVTSGPPPSIDRLYTPVDITINGKKFPGTIDFVRTDPGSKVNTYDVKLANGQIEKDVQANRLEVSATSKTVGGVLFLDEAYDLKPSSEREGQAILAEIMAAAENHRDVLTIILAGYKEDIEKELFSYNVGMPSRFELITFDDFTEEDLLLEWKKKCSDDKWKCPAQIANVAARRLARGIGRKGFGNARELRQLYEKAVSEAKLRFLEDDSGAPPSFQMQDIIGLRPDRSTNPALDRVLTELDRMTGQKKVKKAMYSIVQLAESNYEHELKGERQDYIALNRVFIGNPGTGKTTVARLYGELLKCLNILSKGDVVYRTPKDFKGQAVGESERQTKAILEMAKGSVLIIDEAYGLNDQGYGKQVLDTIVESVTGKPGEDLAVIVAGYKADMNKMFTEQNPGLSRRFNAASPVEFEDFNDDELLEVVSGLCSKFEIRAPIATKIHAVKKLSQLRNLPHFGNAGAVETMVNDAKARMSERLRELRERSHSVVHAEQLEIVDFEHDDPNARQNPLDALEGLYEMDEIKKKMQDLGVQIRIRNQEGRQLAGLVGNWVFTGNPGTGKTTVAKSMAKILHGFGLLARNHVEITSGEDMSGEYVGQTKEKVQKLMEAARGGVFFIDEAYRMGIGPFGQEAMTKLLSMLTEDEYKDGKTVVILAGYNADIDEMFSRNVGLRSRFKDRLHFKDWSDSVSADFIVNQLKMAKPVGFAVKTEAGGDAVQQAKQLIEQKVGQLKQREGWANVRDLQENLLPAIISRRDVRLAGENAEPGMSALPDNAPTVLVSDIQAAFDQMIAERPLLQSPSENFFQDFSAPPMDMKFAGQARKPVVRRLNQQQNRESTDPGGQEGEYKEARRPRDQGVADADWEELQKAIDRSEEEELKKLEQNRQAEERASAEFAELERRRKELEAEQERLRQKAEQEKREEERRRALAELARKEAEAKRVRDEQQRLERERSARQEAERKAKELEERRQSKVRQIGLCEAGYAWYKVAGGYRCKGGTHYVSDQQIGF